MSDSCEALFKRQRVLADFGDLALCSEDLDEILHEACRLVAEAMGTSRAKVLELKPGGESLLVRAGVGWASDVVGQVSISMRENSSESFSIKAGAPVITQDIRTETRFGLAPFLKDAGVIALTNVPIFLPGRRAYGLLEVDDTKPRDFDEADTEFLRTYATILGSVIDRLLKVHKLRSAEERFRLTVEAATDYAILVTDAEYRITDWLPGAAAVFGWSAQEAMGQSAAVLFTPEDREAGAPETEQETARRKGHTPDVRWHQRRDGSRVFIDGIVRALHVPGGALGGFLKVGQDVTKRQEADERLRASEDQLRTLIEGIPQLVWRSLDRGEWIWASPQWLAFTGQTQEQSHGQGWLDVIHPDDRGRARQAWGGASSRGMLDVELRVRRASDGAYVWHHARSVPTRDDQGRIVEWLGTTTDVQELKELQERQTVMVAELQHRTRNLITVVRSIARQTMASMEPIKAVRDAFDSRLEALSRVQGLLSRAEQEPITLRALLKLELDALGATEGAQATLDGPPVRLRPTIVQTLALVLHELGTNARKHGALSEGGGRLGVRWRVWNGDRGRRVHIEWREEDLSCPVEAAQSALGRQGGYGRRLIEQALPYALEAETTFELGPTELRCTIDLPLDRQGNTRTT